MAVTSTPPAALSSLPRVSLEAAQDWAQANGRWIKLMLDQHAAWIEEAEVEKYQAAYDGYLESVDTRDKARGDDTNYKIFVNLAQLIIDVAVDYIIAKPPVWTVYDSDLEKGKKEPEILEEFRKKLLKKLRTEQAQRVLAEQLRQGSIAFYSPVICWVDEKGNIDFEEFPVQEVIPVYDTRGRLVMVLRRYEMEVATDAGTEKYTRVDVYDDRYITYYRSNETGDGYVLDDTEIETGNPIEHKAGRIPVSVFTNGTAARYSRRVKRAGTSDLESVFSIIDAYANAVSDKANLVDYLQDQYLKLKGVDTDEKEVIKMRKARAIALKSKDSDAEFIAQDQSDTAVENYLKRLEDLSYDTTFTPKLNDLQGATATEIKMKYANLDIKAGKKETYFTTAINDFIAIVTDLMNAEKLVAAGVESPYEILSDPEAMEKRDDLYNAEWVQFTLKRNMPQNYKEIADIVSLLIDKVPDAYLYELLWFIDDPVAALEEMKAQREERAKLEAQTSLTALGYGGEFANLEGENNEEGEE
jgi:SPP1 family phage portal protein